MTLVCRGRLVKITYFSLRGTYFQRGDTYLSLLRIETWRAKVSPEVVNIAGCGEVGPARGRQACSLGEHTSRAAVSSIKAFKEASLRLGDGMIQCYCKAL
jgi:hypothetical protein